MTGRIFRASVILIVFLEVSCTPVLVNYTNPEGPKFIGHLAGPPPVFNGTLKVVSYNIKLSMEVEQAVSELESLPRMMDADVLLLQEMDRAGVHAIAQKLKFNYVYYPAAKHSTHDRGFGNAVLSPWPITKHMKVVLPHEHPIRRMNRNAVFATLSIGEFELLAVSVHTEVFILGNAKRLDQIEAIVDHIGRTNQLVVVGGDFNTESGYAVRETERIFRKAGFTVATQDVGPTAKGDPLGIFDFQMDFLFVKGLSVEASGKVEEARASDHLPVWATLRPEKTH